MTLKDKSEKMLGGLHKLGKKYGFKPSPEKPPEYIIDNWIDVRFGYDVPNRINVGNQVDNALQEVERLLTGN